MNDDDDLIEFRVIPPAGAAELDPASIRAVCATLLPELDASNDTLVGRIDGFSDVRQLPPTASTALDALRQLDERRFGPPPPPATGWLPWLRRVKRASYMDIEIDLRDEIYRETFLDFAGYSINAEVYGDPIRPLLSLHDTASSLLIRLTTYQHAKLDEEFANKSLGHLALFLW